MITFRRYYLDKFLLSEKFSGKYEFQRWTDVKFNLELKSINIQPMGGLFTVVYDLLLTSLNSASINRNSIKNKVIRKFIIPLLSKIFLYLDSKYQYK